MKTNIISKQYLNINVDMMEDGTEVAQNVMAALIENYSDIDTTVLRNALNWVAEEEDMRLEDIVSIDLDYVVEDETKSFDDYFIDYIHMNDWEEKITIEEITQHGPAGGNPNVWISGKRGDLIEFVKEFYSEMNAVDAIHFLTYEATVSK